MKRLTILLLASVLLAGCGGSQAQLRKRAAELCRYIPDHELLEQSVDFLTEDFYAVLDTMFYRLPEHEAMDHEWLYYFVTGNGGTIADYEVVGVEKTDASHAVATIRVRQKWEDGSFDPESDVEDHRMAMEKVDGRWLMSDFDGHKADCVRYIAINRREQAVRQAIADYLVAEIGPQYRQGELCVPVLMMVREEDDSVWGDFWVFWYNRDGETLKTVSGGNHAGRMTLHEENGTFRVTAFEQTVDGAGNDASARRIFGDSYDIYRNMHSNDAVREAVRREQLGEYVRSRGLAVRSYQDFGWDAVAL
ncbi:MAG: hypothetical protein K6F42_01550 [Bacteroidales bacterium]|nr:hypothetical protein [Bacteroidales bacterium]